MTVAAAPIMHPLFGNAEQVPKQVPPANNVNMMTPGIAGQNQYYGNDQNYMNSLPQAAPMSINQTGYYQQPQQPQQQMQDTSNVINYQNFNNFAGAPQQISQQDAQSPPPTVHEVKEKAPLPEEFIYLQTVLEELKTQCISRATNPVS